MRVVHLEGTSYAWNFKRFPQECADLGISPRHVLHVGGHLGQEAADYRAAGATRITYMEPNPESARALRQLGDDVRVIQAAAGLSVGRAALALCGGDGAWDTLRANIGDNGRHEGVHVPHDVVSVDVLPIRDVQGDADVIVVDTQGTEIEALQSADLGEPVQLVIVETQSSGHPEAAHVDDVNALMAAQGWAPVLAWNHEHPDRPHATFADVFYLPVAESS